MAEEKLIKLIKNVHVYAPQFLGKRDVFISADKICSIQEKIELHGNVDIDIVDGKGKILIPGLIDSHVHITGGGGEGSFKTRTPEIVLSHIIKAGVTTVVGCLGTDGVTRTMGNLIAKANALEEEGISCYIYTGSYYIPPKTLLGSIQADIIFVDKIIGVGEIALSDHRSSQPTFDELARLTAEARVGGMLSGKAGIVNVHLGDGKRKLDLIKKIVDTTEIPISQFLPTHTDRNADLLADSLEFAKSGGLIDFTTAEPRDLGERKNVMSSDLLVMALEQGVPIKNVSFSSDGQGSLPVFDAKGNLVGLQVGNIFTLFAEIRDCVITKKIPIETALQVATSNPARNLKLKNKGKIEVNADADLVLLNQDWEIDTVIAKGIVMMKDKNILVKGTFEK